MDWNDIMQGVQVGAGLLGTGFTTYCAIWTSSIISCCLSKKIKSQEELEKVVQKEAEKLGIEDIKIESKLYEELRAGALPCSKDGQTVDYWLLHVGGFLASHSVVRHELYHIKRAKQTGKILPKSVFDYYLNEEPRAMVYEAYRLKI